MFERPLDAKRWCIIHRTDNHDSENCTMYLEYEQEKRRRAEAAEQPHVEPPRWKTGVAATSTPGVSPR